MSPNKRTVDAYMNAFRVLDHAAILACLAEDVEWIIPGAFHIKGKAAFDKEIENDAFTGRPIITVTSAIEENDVVVTEGTVQCQRRDGPMLKLAFCDVFTLRHALITRLVSYLVELK